MDQSRPCFYTFDSKVHVFYMLGALGQGPAFMPSRPLGAAQPRRGGGALPPRAAGVGSHGNRGGAHGTQVLLFKRRPLLRMRSVVDESDFFVHCFGGCTFVFLEEWSIWVYL